MKRKLVRQGAATMMISLPSKWIRENKLGKGDEIDLIQDKGKIILGTDIREKKEITLELKEESKKDLKSILSHVYRKGVDKVILKNTSKDLAKKIRKITENFLLGFEITEINKNEVIIENISEPEKSKYDIMLKKAFQIIQETGQIVLDDFNKNSFDHLEDIGDLSIQQERFILFCRRLLVTGATTKNKLVHWELLTFLLHIQHRYNYFYQYASKAGLKKSNKILDLLKNATNYFEMYKDAYFNQDVSLIYKINNLKDEYWLGKCISYLEKSSGKETIILAYIREIFRIIQIGTSPILTELLENNKDQPVSS